MSDRGELTWRTSARSSGGQCVEIADDGDRVHIRDSKDADGPVLTFDRETFRAFIDSVKDTGPDAG